jgi:hypothetical protein
MRLLDEEHEVRTAYQMRWAEKKNGELLRLVEEQFEVFLTVDQNLRHQQNLRTTSLRIVILVAERNDYDLLAALIPKVTEAFSTLTSGEVIEISS